MPRLVTTLAIAALAAIAGPAAAQTGGSGGAPTNTTPTPPPPPTPKLKVERPSKKLYIREGQPNRLRLGGTWYFRQDNELQGVQGRYFAQRSLVGWSKVSVPNTWNGSDTKLDAQGVGWYRKEFKLPRAPHGRRWQWRVRFESVNNRATVWLNGKQIGAGGPSFMPFELDLKGLKKGRNRLVVRASNRRSHTDLTHWRPYGGGGWWNFGGISREVYVRPMDTVDMEDLAVIPRLPKLHGAARVQVTVSMRNLSRKKRRIQLALLLRGKGRSSQRIDLSPRNMDPMSRREIKTSFLIQKPRLWQPGHPNLYRLTASAAVAGKRVTSYVRYFGVRQIKKKRNGQVYLNGHKLQLRGASIHEDEPNTGAALTPKQRSNLVSNLRKIHATFVRAHYPLHPAFLEAFDRAGIVVWSEAPVYQLPNNYLNISNVRNAAVSVVRRMVERDRSHPSILAWSIGNELAGGESEHGAVGPGFARYVRDAAKQVRSLDKTRLVALDRQSRIGEPTYNRAFNTLDALGINDYFGWYRSAPVTRGPSRTDELGPFLDGVHAAHPQTALFITEFGAESTFPGAASQRGSFAFQSNYLRAHLKIHASKPFVNGSLIWILKDFRVVPGWTGGNDPRRSTPPWNNKGLIDQSGTRKLAFTTVRRLYKATRPLR
ncbi:MAG TPA: glycoside hydrolase family 2 TIM barrel-domain containing protein [Thermoleophilaceae bacterium]